MTTFNVPQEIEKVLERFADELLKVFRAGVVAALSGDVGPVGLTLSSGRKGRAVAATGTANRRGLAGTRKSSPEEVEALAVRIIEALRKEGRLLSSAALQERVRAESGPFHYALNKLKKSRRVNQVGERRMAQYGVDADTTEPRGRGGRKPSSRKAATRTAASKPARKPTRKASGKPTRKTAGKTARKASGKTARKAAAVETPVTATPATPAT